MRFGPIIIVCTSIFTPSVVYANGYQHFDGIPQRDDFFATVDQLGSTTTIDFVGFPHGTEINTQYEDLGVLFGPTGPVLSAESGFFTDGYGIFSLPYIEIIFAEPQDWFAVDLGSPQVADGGAADFYNNGAYQFTAPFGLYFAAIIADRPFDRVVFFDEGGQHAVIDDLHFGAASTVPAPPSALVFVLSGLVLRRRRRAG